MKQEKQYLISAADYFRAREIAMERKLLPSQWKYVPVDKNIRFSAISGCHAFPKENLLGDFTEEEIIYLTIEAPKQDDPAINSGIIDNPPKTTISRSGENGLYLSKPKEGDTK